MKPWLPQLRSHYAQPVTRLALYWRVVRHDGQVFGFVDHDQDISVGGVHYGARAGLAATATQTTMDLQPGTLDVTAFLDVSTEAEIDAGIWDEARVTVFEARWDSPPTAIDAEQCNILMHGRLGKIDRKTGTFQAQLHGLLEQLDTQIGRVFTATCPWRLGDSRCQVDVGPYTRTGTVSALGEDARYSFSDEGQGEVEGFFSEGVITFSSGANAGSSMDVRQWAPPWFHLHRPLPYPPALGDTYSAVKGDSKTFTACNSFANKDRFGGFPMLPGIDAVLHNPLTRPLT